MPLVTTAQGVLPPIGQWREHLPYQNTIDVAASANKIIAATPYSLFTVDVQSGEIDRISKVSALSETGLSRIAYDITSGKLFIGYANSNMDVIINGRVVNVPGLKRANVSGDKNIYQIVPDNQLCYLATGFGVVVFDAVKYEIKDSWFIGSAGGAVKTNGFLKYNNNFYAATDEGLKTTGAAVNPADFRNWTTISGTNGLSATTTRAVVNFNNQLIVLQNDSLFIQSGQQWQLYFANDWKIEFVNASENKLLIGQRKTTGEAQVVVLSGNGTAERVIQQTSVIGFPKNGISVNGIYWIADLYGGLSRWSQSASESYRPNSPQAVSTGAMLAGNGNFYVTAGAVNSSWNYQYNPSGFFVYEHSNWTNYNQYSFPVLDTVLDIITVAADRRDGSAWLGSFGGGLVKLDAEGKLQIFKQNSPIGATVGDPNSYRVAGLAFDTDNNLWIANFGSTKQLHVLRSNGQWQSFTAPFTLRENAVADIVIDEAGNKWMVAPLGNGLIVFNERTFENTLDDQWKLLRAGSGTGNLPSNDVLSVAKDREGFIWVGTNNGVAVFECPDIIFASNSCEAVWPVVKEGNFANYLFKGQEVRSIAVDGANRIWMATNTGVWLVNTPGDKVLAHFTEENSPLLSNDVKKIAIDGITGEVFIATSKGLVSYRGSATDAEEYEMKAIVFPNPVPPGYTGTIGIRGLPDNAIVKITELNGRLVHQTRSLGGQAVWSGKDYNGRRVSTGVYLVLAIDEKNQQHVVGKIVFVK